MRAELLKVINEYLSLGIDQQLDYGKFYLYSIITHSTAIEGSTVTEIENRLLFDEGISANKPMAEQLMNLDLKKAYEQAFVYAEKHEKITVELLCSLAALVMKNTGTTYNTIGGSFSSAKGELRLLNVSAGSMNYVSLETVLSQSGAISQQLLGWITVMTTGRSSTIRCGRFGTVELIHTAKNFDKIMPELRFDRVTRMLWASEKLAMQDMKDCKRPLDLIES